MVSPESFDIALIVKQGEKDRVFVAASDIRTTQPLPEVKLRVLDYQQQTVGEGHTDDQGVSMIRVSHKPFLLIASKGQQMGYLRLDDASANSVSHFDVSGQMVQKGIKGLLYGERGVWRPGDPLYLTFILVDPESRPPENHPVRFELFNPRGQLVKTLIRKESINGFYGFHAKTDPDAPTGNWRARVRVGGVSFEKMLKIETVMPNRLKINLDFGEYVKSLTEGPVNVQLSARWLHGAVAKKLKSDVSLQLTSRSTRFPGYESYAFDDPVRRYRTEKTTVFEGMVDEKGLASFSSVVKAKNVSPGMLTASFTTRVFEPGGAFSTDQCNIAFHPYEQYVGVQVPAGDKARGMLLTDKDHTIRIVLVDASGEAVPVGEVEVEMYKINWRWWWERGEENLANYVGRASHRPIRRERVRIDQGRGEWHFQIKYPASGRYLIRVRDLKGDHITGKIFYIDWPGWAGRAQKEMPGGASVLSFSADKTEYGVGEKVALTIPTGKRGRGLLSIETGSKILQTAWIEGGEEAIRYEFEATARMVPNIYVHVTFLQPHLEAGNDLPIRMYGIVPIKIVDAQTVLNPQIDAADVFTPEEKATITVSEQNGKPMTYTLALVDEGLLDLTRFETPDPWSHFYGREALGVKTWDLYDEVAGAYGTLLEQFLAIGGDKTEEAPTEKKAERFPPMVRFLGPFELEKDGRHAHQVEIPQYVGSVRIMVVGGQNGAFGKAEKAVFVHKPLMVLGTLPRVLGPDEEVELPVSIFALEDHVRDVKVMVRTEGPLSLEGPAMKSLSFKEPGDKLVSFRLRVGSKIGIASVTMEAEGAGEKTGHRIELDVRLPVSPVVDVVRGVISPGETWEKDFPLPGMPGRGRRSTSDEMVFGPRPGWGPQERPPCSKRNFVKMVLNFMEFHTVCRVSRGVWFERRKCHGVKRQASSI